MNRRIRTYNEIGCCTRGKAQTLRVLPTQQFLHNTNPTPLPGRVQWRDLSTLPPDSKEKGLPCLTQAGNARGKRWFVCARVRNATLGGCQHFLRSLSKPTVRCKNSTTSSWVSALQAAGLTLAIPTRSADAKTMIPTRLSSPQGVLRSRHKSQDALSLDRMGCATRILRP